MRIISGKYKGRQIKIPESIRPTQGLVRKALFDILGDIEGLSFLELFAGSGAVGFEAVSHGVTELTLVEYNSDCIQAIKKNIESLKLKACKLYPRDVQKAIKAFYNEKRRFDIIFLDPPYPKSLVPRPYDKLNKRDSGSTDNLQEQPLSKKTLKTLSAYDILALNGLIIMQHFKKDNLPNQMGDLPRTTESHVANGRVVRGLVLFKQARYGDTVLSFYRKQR